jgi:hypothetical protein
VRLILLALMLATVLSILASSADASTGRTCGYIRASTPYSSHGNRDKWRVYVTGTSNCAKAEHTLDAVMHLEGKEHLGADEARSFFTYRGWSCPFGDMGSQLCDLPARPPFEARALALDCAVVSGGCPTRVPPGYFG